MDAITLTNVSKKYSLSMERPILVKELFKRQKRKEVWALKDINLKIKEGETIGIIGANGSGKSTLLKTISSVTFPTNGTVKVNGRVGSLIELGAGFHPDLSGKENVFLNGSLLGFTRKELEKKYAEIIEFANIGDYIDEPVRTYSSGMIVRLGFSLTILLNPKILLIDEVMAVGDQQFQNKCFKKIEQLQKNKITILFVSHDLFLVEKLCKKSILLSHGKITYFGNTQTSIGLYLKRTMRESKRSIKLSQSNKHADQTLKIIAVDFYDERGLRKKHFFNHENIYIHLKYQNKSKIKKASFGYAAYDSYSRRLFGSSSDLVPLKEGIGNINIKISHNPIAQGELIFSLAITHPGNSFHYDWVEKGYVINIIGDHGSEDKLTSSTSWFFSKSKIVNQ